MIPLPRHSLCLLAALATVNTLAAANAPTYRPLLEPHFTAGQSFGYHADADYKSLFLIVQHLNSVNDDGSTKKSDKDLDNISTRFSVIFVADAALARQVFKNGSLSEAVFQVGRCQLMDDKIGLQTLIPHGAILTARKQKDGQVAFAINGVAPDPQLAAQLSVVIAMGNEQSTNNELLSPPQPVAVGANWPINLQAVLNSDLPACFPGLSSVAGSVSLVKVQDEKTSNPRAVVNAAYSLVGVKPPFGRDFNRTSSTVNFTVFTTTPVIAGSGQYDQKLTSLVRHTGSTGNANVGFEGTDAEFSISIEQNLHFATDSLSPAPATLANAPTAPDAPPVPPGLSSSIILRPPPLWKLKAAQTAGSDKTAPTANPTPVVPAPKPKPAAATTPFVMPSGDSSPFTNAQDPLTVPTSSTNSK